MAEKEVKVSYGALKLQALAYYMEQENTSVEEALKEHLDKLYQKAVPKQVQEFLEKGPLDTEAVQEQGESQQASEVQSAGNREGTPVTDAEQEATQGTEPSAPRTIGRGTQSRASARTQGSTGRSNRNSQRQSEPEQTPATEETADTATPEETEQEENSGMAMSM